MQNFKEKQTSQKIQSVREMEILKRKDKIYDLKKRMKTLEYNREEKAFKYRCIPPKREDAKKAVLKALVLPILLTIVTITCVTNTIRCMFLIQKVDSQTAAVLAISIMGQLLFAIGGTVFGIWLWQDVLKKLVSIRDLKILEKGLRIEIDSLQEQIQVLQKETYVCVKELEERKDADYLQIVDFTEKIDMDNLRKYLAGKFAEKNELEKRIGAPEVIGELLCFGYQTIGDIEIALSAPSPEFYIPEEGTNQAGLLRNLMIIKDCHKYFTTSYKGGWLQVPVERVKFWKEKGAAGVESYLKQYKIEVKV